MKNIQYKSLQRELLIREAESRTQKERDDFFCYVISFFKEYWNLDFLWNWHYSIQVEGITKIIEEQKNTPSKEREIRYIFINVPPGSGKTELWVKLLPTWLYGNNPYLDFILTGHTDRMVKGFSGIAKNYYESKAYRRIFPRRNKLHYSADNKWGVKGKGVFQAMGFKGGITGEGADIVIVDDALKAGEADSPLQRNNVNERFDNTVPSRLRQNKLRICVIIMQRLHDNDLCGHLFAKKSIKEGLKTGKHLHICVPAIAIEDEEYRRKGESFHPSMVSVKALKSMKNDIEGTQGSHVFAAQYQQNPLDVANAEFKKSFFQYFTDSIERKYIEGYIGVDIALSEKNTADWRSIVVVAKDKEGKFYVRENYYSRKNSSDVMDDLFMIQEKYGYPVILEANGAQKYFADAVNKNMAVVNQFFYLKEITTRGDKNARMRATLLPLYKNFRIFHEEGIRNDELENEILRFPKAKHDDNMDALETAISGFYSFSADDGEMEEGEIEIEGFNTIGGDPEVSNNDDFKRLLSKKWTDKGNNDDEEEEDWY